MKNTLGDLNNHLFSMLEKLNNDNLKGEALTEEINRARAINDVATRIISTGSLVLNAKRLVDDRMDADLKLPKMLEG